MEQASLTYLISANVARISQGVFVVAGSPQTVIRPPQTNVSTAGYGP